MKTDRKTYAILVNPRMLKLSEYGTFQVSIVQVEANGVLRNPDSDDAFNDLIFSCQWDEKSATTYAWQITYRDVYRVDVCNARRMYKTLQKVEKFSEKFPVQPTTFGQHVALSAKAVGIKIGRKESRHSGGHSTYSENEYLDLSLSDVRYSIDQIIADARERSE